ncbi:MAG: hypothetical protein MJE77_22090 [Proteobacteria bacterium]|nr:hypothetical protein [Pseudomonadota bacterium]
MRCSFAALLIAGLASCANFNPSSAELDSESCPTAAMTVDGIAVQDGQTVPSKTVLIGDTITLRAAGACVQTDSMVYQWSFDPVGIADTADRALTAETIQIYPVQAGSYTVSLTVKNGRNGMAVIQGVAFEAADWTALDHFSGIEGGRVSVRGLSASSNTLWVAAAQGGYMTPVVDPEAGIGYDLVNDAHEVASDVPSDTLAVHHDRDKNHVWFSNNVLDDRLYRVIPGTSRAAFTAPTDSRIRDIDSSSAAVFAAGSDGVFTFEGSGSFGIEREFEAAAVAVMGSRLFIGTTRELIEIDQTDVAADIKRDIFAGVNDEIEALLVYNGELWIGSNARRIARYNPSTDTKTVYSSADGLPDAAVRDLAVDAAGDIWAATARGVARFKADRQVWLHSSPDGLKFRNDLRAIAIDETETRRAIYVGGERGLSCTRVP